MKRNKIITLISLIFIILGIIFFYLEYREENNDKFFLDIEVPIEDYEDKEEENNDIKEEDKINNKVDLNYIGILEIPKINLKRGFLPLESKYNSIKYNVQVIEGSTFPDQENNNLVLAAHSGNCHICYFDDLYKLELKDTANIYYKNIKYTYEIVNIYEVEKTGTVEVYIKEKGNYLTLITCTKNSSTKQTVYILELKSKSK